MVAISEFEAGRTDEASSDGDLLLWPRPMRKGAGDMPGIATGLQGEQIEWRRSKW
jgi:hypothetical protein